MPEPAARSRAPASHAMRSAGAPSSTTDSARLSRSSGPRSVKVRSPIWAATSAVTRSLAVAVVASTGTPSPSEAITVASRR